MKALENSKASIEDYCSAHKSKFCTSVNEHISFLEWLRDGNFIFLGSAQYEVKDKELEQVEGKNLGILKHDYFKGKLPLDINLYDLQAVYIYKIKEKSLIHRPSNMTVYNGKNIREGRLCGLYKLFWTLYFFLLLSERPEDTYLERKVTKYRKKI